jgi:hypothetical protein
MATGLTELTEFAQHWLDGRSAPPATGRVD